MPSPAGPAHLSTVRCPSAFQCLGYGVAIPLAVTVTERLLPSLPGLARPPALGLAIVVGALDDVQKLFRRDPEAASRMLDQLIAYLRAALPQMRGGTSTVGGEIDLARACVAVLGARLAFVSPGDRHAAEVVLPEPTAPRPPP